MAYGGCGVEQQVNLPLPDGSVVESGFNRRRFLGAAALAGLAAAGSGGAASAAARAAPPAPATRGDRALNVRSFGARGDGQTDDTRALQKALDTAGRQGGNIVFPPPGHYRLGGSLQVPQCVTLQGTFESPQSGSGADHAPPYHQSGGGSVLWAVGGRGQPDGQPLFSLHRSSALFGVSVFYPEQDPDHVVEYPWTVRRPSAIAYSNGRRPAVEWRRGLHRAAPAR